MQFIDFIPGVDTTKVTFPVVTIDAPESTMLRGILAQHGSVNVTINNEANYFTTQLKFSGSRELHFLSALLLRYAEGGLWGHLQASTTHLQSY
jgi:hypothetical protein